MILLTQGPYRPSPRGAIGSDQDQGKSRLANGGDMGPVGQGVRGVSRAWGGGGSFFGNPYMDYATPVM